MSNKGEVTDISKLPIKTIKYGPIRFELEKVKVVIGPIVCQPSEKGLTIREKMVANQIEELQDFDRVIRNETEDLKTKVTETSEKIQHLIESIDRCPIENSGYFEVLGKCYFTDKISRNFDDSQAHCKEIFPIGGRLFEPRDETTNKKVVKAKKKYHGGSYRGSTTWIGITDRRSQGNYRYLSDNGQLTVSSKWLPGLQPNCDSECECVDICRSNGYWCDRRCSTLNYHLCERTN